MKLDSESDADRLGKLIAGNSAGLSIIAFASYFDVFSHQHWFVNIDPWYNPAHLLLYLGILVLVVATYRWGKAGGHAARVAWLGILAMVAAAVFNEVWHRVLLFGNPLPEPFPVEPPHALLAVGISVCGAAALLYPLGSKGPKGKGWRLAVSFLAGALWLIVAGSFFYVGTAYATTASYALAVVFASFTSAFFLRYTSALTGRVGYASLSYLFFLAVNYLFFVTAQDGLPAGVLLVLLVDFLLVRGGSAGSGRGLRLGASVLLAALYGIVYFPLLPAGVTLALNPYLAASAVGVAFAWLTEKIALLTLRRQMPQNLSENGQILTA